MSSSWSLIFVGHWFVGWPVLSYSETVNGVYINPSGATAFKLRIWYHHLFRMFWYGRRSFMMVTRRTLAPGDANPSDSSDWLPGVRFCCWDLLLRYHWVVLQHSQACYQHSQIATTWQHLVVVFRRKNDSVWDYLGTILDSPFQRHTDLVSFPSDASGLCCCSPLRALVNFHVPILQLSTLSLSPSFLLSQSCLTTTEHDIALPVVYSGRLYITEPRQQNSLLNLVLPLSFLL